MQDTNMTKGSLGLAQCKQCPSYALVWLDQINDKIMSKCSNAKCPKGKQPQEIIKK